MLEGQTPHHNINPKITMAYSSLTLYDSEYYKQNVGWAIRIFDMYNKALAKIFSLKTINVSNIIRRHHRHHSNIFRLLSLLKFVVWHYISRIESSNSILLYFLLAGNDIWFGMFRPTDSENRDDIRYFSDGTQITYSNWDHEDPNHFDWNEDCITAISNKTTSGWT